MSSMLTSLPIYFYKHLFGGLKVLISWVNVWICWVNSNVKSYFYDSGPTGNSFMLFLEKC